MAVKSIRTPTRRKSPRINPKVVASIIHISDECKKENARIRWGNALQVYLATLDRNQFSIVEQVMMFWTQKPRLIDTSCSCEVIPFPSVKNQSKSAAEA